MASDGVKDMEFSDYVNHLNDLLSNVPESAIPVLLTAAGTTIMFFLGRAFWWSVRKSTSLAWYLISYPFRSHHSELEVLVISSLTSENAKFSVIGECGNNAKQQPCRLDSGNVWGRLNGMGGVCILVGGSDATEFLSEKVRIHIKNLILSKYKEHQSKVHAEKVNALQNMIKAGTTSKIIDPNDQNNVVWTVDNSTNPPTFWPSTTPPKVA